MKVEQGEGSADHLMPLAGGGCVKCFYHVLEYFSKTTLFNLAEKCVKMLKNIEKIIKIWWKMCKNSVKYAEFLANFSIWTLQPW